MRADATVRPNDFLDVGIGSFFVAETGMVENGTRHRISLSQRIYNGLFGYVNSKAAIARARAGASLLAMILYAKFGQHQPLNRQSDIYAREGNEIDVSTLANSNVLEVAFLGHPSFPFLAALRGRRILQRPMAYTPLPRKPPTSPASAGCIRTTRHKVDLPGTRVRSHWTLPKRQSR